MSQYNQYQAPNSPVDRAGVQQFGEVKVFSASGRIGRLRFLAYWMVAYLLATIISGAAQAALLGATGDAGTSLVFLVSGVLILAQLVLYFMFAIQRSHDMNMSGWLSLIILIPIIGFLVFLIAPGTKGDNNYGPPPPPNNVGVILAAFIFPLIIIGILAAIAIPAYQGYIERANELKQEQQYEQQR